MKYFSIYIKQLYPDHAEKILAEIEKYKQTLKVTDNASPNTRWYKYVNLYAIYPDSIRTREQTPLQALIPHLDHIKDLGCNAMHILPFLDSPMVDKGFDIRDYYTIRKDIGTLTDIKQVIHEAHKKGIRVFMDLVFNHVSDQHEWFLKAQDGDPYYRNYFIHQKTQPAFTKVFQKDSAVWAEYIVKGEKKAVNIAFPEHVGAIPHWRQGNDGYWYYHTYYPQQLDVNWKNPAVFLEFAKIIMYWTSLGFNFRLDAIPFVGKSAYKEVDNSSAFTRTLLATIRSLAESINEETVLIVETYEKEHTIIDYFGNNNIRQAQLAYNFHLCTYLWVALTLQNTEYIWKKLNSLSHIPAHAEWINFLRNHDELSLSHLDEKLLQVVKDKVMKLGAPFRKQYGIAGRTYSLLQKKEKRYLNAYFLLTSMPGGILIPYGDDVGKTNIPLSNMSPIERKDTRNINRGVLTHNDLTSAKGKRIFAKIKEFIEKRQVLRDYLNIWPAEIRSQKEVFSARYRNGSSELYIFINISDKKQNISFRTEGFSIITKLFSVTLSEKTLTLAPYAGIWLQK